MQVLVILFVSQLSFQQMIFINLCTFIFSSTHSFAQFISQYPYSDKRFQAFKDYLVLPSALEIKIYNSSTLGLSFTIPRNKSAYSYPADEGLMVYNDGRKYMLIYDYNGTLIRYLEFPMDIGGTTEIVFNRDVTVTKNYAYIFQRDTSIDYYSIKVYTKNLTTIVGEIVYDFRMTAVSQDEDGFYLTVNTSSNDIITSYNLTKYDKEGKFSWSVALHNCDDKRFYALGNYPFVITFCENVIYQLNSLDGGILRRFGTSSFQIKRLKCTETDIFVFCMNGKVLQFSLIDGQFVHIYEDKTNPLDSNGVILYDGGVVEATNNFVFFNQPSSSTSSSILGCASNNFVMQYAMKKTAEITEFTYKSPDLRLSFNETVTHNNIYHPSSFASSTFIKRFDLIRMVLPQNSYFTPFIIPGRQGYYNFSFFSGNGDVSTAVCNDNFMHTIQISTLEETVPAEIPKFVYWPTKLFYTANTQCSKRAWSNADVFQTSALYDYAATLVQDNENYYYIIHGGCPCYINLLKSAILIIRIDPNYSFTYTFGSSNINMAR
jgi:hypothetical protein